MRARVTQGPPRRRRSPAAPTSTATTRDAPFDLVKTDVVHPDDLAALDIYDLPVQKVALEEDLVLATLEFVDVDRSVTQSRAGAVKALDRAPGHEDLAPLVRHDEAGHRWVLVADRDDQVGDRPERLVSGVAHRPTDDLTQEEHVPPHGGWFVRHAGSVGADRVRRA